MKHTIVLFLFLIVAQSESQYSNTLMLSIMNDVQYQCVDPGCSSPIIMFVSNSKSCQIACLMDANCRTATFDQSMNQCELSPDIPSEYGSMISQAGVVTLTAIDNRQRSAPMTTSTTTSTTTATATTTTSSSTSTTTTTTTTATSSSSSTTSSSTSSSTTTSTTTSSSSSTSTKTTSSSSSTTSSSTSSTSSSSSTSSTSSSTSTTTSSSSSTSSTSSSSSSSSSSTSTTTTSSSSSTSTSTSTSSSSSSSSSTSTSSTSSSTTITTATTAAATSPTSVTTPCTTPATTTTVTASALPSQCSSYTLITDGTRNANYAGGTACDQTGSFASAAWYGFSGAAGTLLASCVVPSNQCNTDATGWYSGVYPSAAGSTTSGTVCYNWAGNNCWESNSISVTNCNGYYVFYLPPTPVNCNLRYCTV